MQYVLTGLVVAAAFAGAVCGKSGDPSSAERSQRSVGPAADENATEQAEESAGDAGAEPPRAEDRGPEHEVYSLVDNRLAAHIGREGGLFIPAGSAGFAKYLRFPRDRNPWALREERGDTTVARLRGPRATLRVPLTAEQVKEETPVSLRVFSPRAQSLAIRIGEDGGQTQRTDVKEGWSTLVFELPADWLRAGENTIQLLAGQGPPIDVDTLQIGGTSDPRGRAPLFDGGALRIPDSGELVYYVMVPEGGRVTGDVGEGACDVVVEAASDRGNSIRDTLEGEGAAVQLDDLADEVVRLSLSAPECEGAKLEAAALSVPGEAPGPVPEKPAPENAVLWVMDSLRADRVRPFNPDARPETPVFDELAEKSAVFTQAYAQGNESRASHAAIWSSLYPAKHGMPQNGSSLDSHWTTIDELMKSAGKLTSGVTGNGYVTSRAGFGTQWDRYRNHIHLEAGLQGERILSRGLASVKEVEKPWFLYLGTIDTHVSWRAKEPWIDTYDPEPYQGRFRRVVPGPLVDRIAAGEDSISERDIQRVRAIYDSNVSYQDQLLGELLETLEERGVADETMIVITADHGDELWEAGRVGHGGSLRDAVVHVPLLVYYPPLVPGETVSEGAEVIDILPTFADALGLEPDEEWQGQSLIPLARGIGQGYPRMSVSSLYERAHAARIGPWKLRVQGRKWPRLFNVGKEAEEKTDVAGDHPFAHRFVADALWTLRTYNDAWKKHRWGNAANVREAFPADMSE